MGDRTGKSLEREFAEFMKTELGFKNTRLRVPMKGAVAERGYEVDICGEQYMKFWDGIRTAAYAIGVLFLGFLLFPKQFEDIKPLAAIVSKDVSFGALVIIVFMVLLMKKAQSLTTAYCWVECKDTKGNVKRAQLQKLHSSVEDVRALASAKWKPTSVMIVTSSDFDADAINFAKEYEYRCFKKVGNTFQEVL